MNKAPLILLIMASTCVHAATPDDANSALLENMARFDQYEQTAQQMSHGQTDMSQLVKQQNQTPPSQPTQVMPSKAPQIQQARTPDTANSSVYQSIKILIESGNLTDKEKIKLISALSS